MGVEVLSFAVGQFALLWLVFARLAGIFFLAPFFGTPHVPTQVKIAFGLLASLALLPVARPPQGGIPSGLWAYAEVLIREAAVGLALGFLAFLLFAAVQVAGQFIDVQIGFSLANFFDPSLLQPVPLLANFLYIFALLLYLGADAHHFLLRALAGSLQAIPIGQAHLTGTSYESLFRLFGTMWVYAARIAAPGIVALLVATVTLGLVSRLVPGINVFILGIPLQIAVGIAILAASLPVTSLLLQQLFPLVEAETTLLLRSLGVRP